MMDFLFLLVFIMKDEDLDRVYKLMFRLDDIAAKNCDFGAEMTVKGHVTDILNSWEEHLILRYAEKAGWDNTERVLDAFDRFLAEHGRDDALEIMARDLLKEDFFTHGEKPRCFIDDFCGQFREKIRKTVFLRALRKWFSKKDETLIVNVVGVSSTSRKGSEPNPQEMEDLQAALDGYVVRRIRSKRTILCNFLAVSPLRGKTKRRDVFLCAKDRSTIRIVSPPWSVLTSRSDKADLNLPLGEFARKPFDALF